MKFQIPITNKTTSGHALRYWNLHFGILLEFDPWNLEFPAEGGTQRQL